MIRKKTNKHAIISAYWYFNRTYWSCYFVDECVLFFSRPPSKGWPHHRRTFVIYLCPLLFWLTLLCFSFLMFLIVFHCDRVKCVIDHCLVLQNRFTSSWSCQLSFMIHVWLFYLTLVLSRICLVTDVLCFFCISISVLRNFSGVVVLSRYSFFRAELSVLMSVAFELTRDDALCVSVVCVSLLN